MFSPYWAESRGISMIGTIITLAIGIIIGTVLGPLVLKLFRIGYEKVDKDIGRLR